MNTIIFGEANGALEAAPNPFQSTLYLNKIRLNQTNYFCYIYSCVIILYLCFCRIDCVPISLELLGFGSDFFLNGRVFLLFFHLYT